MVNDDRKSLRRFWAFILAFGLLQFVCLASFFFRDSPLPASEGHFIRSRY